MTISVVKHTDPGAPTLNGVAGTLIAVLDYCLPLQGWSKVFTGTNKAVYRAPTGNRFYLRVDDTQGQYGRLVAYESMTDVDTGVNAFPTDFQRVGGDYQMKSTTLGGTEARPWACVVTPRGFALWTQSAFVTDSLTNAVNYGNMMYFGDIKSIRPGDAYGSVLMAGYGADRTQTLVGYSANTAQGGKYLARAWHGLGGSTSFGTVGEAVGGSASFGGMGLMAFPNPVDNGIYFAPLRVIEGGPAVRGTIPGLWHPVQYYTNFTQMSEVQGSGAMAGKTFLTLGHYNQAMLALEVSDTWEY